MSTNTLKTLAGFFRSVAVRRLPFLARRERLEDIYNYLPIPDLYTTSGQPNERQFQLIKQAGYTSVINLAPTSVLENSVVNEPQILADLEMRYIHIPVDFKNPTLEDFAAFTEALAPLAPDQTWVHCAANMRVSAFTYRYRRDVLGTEPSQAKLELDKIWRPTGVWRKFVDYGQN